MSEIAALVLNEPYASWVMNGKKRIETRMRLFSYSGDLLICMGKNNNHPLAGKALCVVHFGKGRPMRSEDTEAACIESIPGRVAYELSNRRLLSYCFKFTDYAVKKNYQGIFSVNIPHFVTLE